MVSYSTNGYPLGVGYDSKDRAKVFVELSSITVSSVSAAEYQNVSLSSLDDFCSGHIPNEGQVLTWSGSCWAPSTVIVGGASGGGGGGPISLTSLQDVTATLAPQDNYLLAYVGSLTAWDSLDPQDIVANAGYLIVTGANYAITGEAQAWVEAQNYAITGEAQAWVEAQDYAVTGEARAWVEAQDYAVTGEAQAWVEAQNYAITGEAQAWVEAQDYA